MQPIKSKLMKLKKILFIGILPCVRTGLVFFLFSPGLYAQIAIRPYPLAVCSRQTSNLVFPYPIRSVDRGSPDIEVQKARGVDNILQVKAARADFQTTNLTVVTADGQLYSFRVSYQAEPDSLNIRFAEQRMQELRANLHGPGVRDGGLSMQLTGLHLREQLLLLTVHIRNRSALPFDMGVPRVYIRDRKRPKRTAIQEIPLEPVFVYSHGPFLGPGEMQEELIALKPFIFSRHQSCILELADREGGRDLRCRLGRNLLLKRTRYDTPH
jgi:hypothetical protein